jgi:hypothetical protein
MIRKITLLLLACLSIQYGAKAQYCGFDIKHQQLLSSDPGYAQRVQEMNAQWSVQSFLQNNLGQLVADDLNGNGKVYEVPVVLHVMHTGGAVGTIYNPSDATLIAMIDYLNKSFAAMWVGYPDSMSGGTHVPIRFVLAQRAENCGATNGITRTNASAILGADYTNNGVELSTSNGVPELNLKNLDRWDYNNYYNIWIVNRIDGADGTVGAFTAGYAYLPFPVVSATLDGTVMLATQATINEITLVHEMGHAFGLYHVFEGGTTSVCPPNANCNTDGDLICDTDPQMQSTFNCPSGINPCTGTPFGGAVRNFMDYSSCQDRFTMGQRDKMVNTMEVYRRNFIGALAGQPINSPIVPVCSSPTVTMAGNSFNAGPRRVRIKEGPLALLDFNSGGYNDEGNQHYIDRSCHQGASLNAGDVDTILITAGTGTQNVIVYIDYDGNQTFDADELVYSGQAAGTHTITYNVPTLGTMPDLLLCTPLRMRVASDRSSVAAPTPCGVVSGQIEDYTVIITATGVGTGTGTVAASLLTNNPSCFGDALTFTATPSTGISPSFQWFINGAPVAGANNDTFVTTAPGNGASVEVHIYYATSCATDSAVSNAIIVQRSGAVAPTVTMGVTSGSIPNCIDDSLTFTVLTQGNPGNSPTFQWQANGINIPGETGTTYIATNIPNNTTITVVMTSNSSCAVPTTATSNGIVVTHAPLTPTVSIALTNGNNPGCPGQILTFTATPTNAGNNSGISYQWRVNGVNAGSNSPVLTGLFNNGDVVDVILTTTSSCATTPTAASNTITIIYQAITQTVTITNATAFPICSGRPVSFTSSTLGSGNGATYQWRINGVAVPGATTPNFTSSTLAPGDIVTLVVSSIDICVGNQIAVSNAIVAGIIPSSVPQVSINILQGLNPGCLDSVITFEGVVNNFGTNPDGNWYVNDTLVGNGFTFTTSSLDSGDIVTFVANQTDGNCYTDDTVAVDMLIILYETPQAPILSLLGNMLFVNNNQYNYYDWYGPNGLIPGEHTQWYHPGIPGNYYVIRYNGACGAPISNIINISLLDVAEMQKSQMHIYPNPTTGLVTIDWGGISVTSSVEVYNAVGQVVLQQNVIDKKETVLDLATFANGVYFLKVKEENGKAGTVKITLTK